MTFMLWKKYHYKLSDKKYERIFLSKKLFNLWRGPFTLMEVHMVIMFQWLIQNSGIWIWIIQLVRYFYHKVIKVLPTMVTGIMYNCSNFPKHPDLCWHHISYWRCHVMCLILQWRTFLHASRGGTSRTLFLTDITVTAEIVQRVQQAHDITTTPADIWHRCE